MKTTLVILLVSYSLLSLTEAQTAVSPAAAASVPPNQPVTGTVVSYQIGQQGANHRVWQKIVQTTNTQGKIVLQTNQAYVELASGLNHLVNGQWVASKEDIEIAPDGSSAVATNSQHQVYFPGNIYSGFIRLVTPDGKTLQSQPVGLSYSDGSNSVLLAVVTNSTGAILPSGNQVIYTNAFTGLTADLLYTYTRAGFEQNVILRVQPPDPASMGLNPQTTLLQVLTEFFNPPQPSVMTNTISTAAGNLEDDNLSFGAMAMGQGKAFLLGANSPAVMVNKRWLTLAGRQFLVEEVPLVSIASAIDTLPQPVAQVSSRTKYIVSKNLILPPQRLTQTAPKTPFLTRATPPNRGLMLDYQLCYGNLANYTFRSDTTYFLVNSVYLSGTSNVFEGGTVLKYDYNAFLSSWGWPMQISCRTGPYRPVILTAKDDNSVGEILPNSTGTPTNYYATAALSFSAAQFPSPIAHFRIAHAQTAIGVSGVTVTFADGQIVNCQTGISMSGGNYHLNNVLFANTMTDINGNGANLYIGNATFCGSTNLIASASCDSIYCTNCIFANVTNLTKAAYVDLEGDYNGFYNCPEFGSGPQTNNLYPFQTVGAGNYYLTNGCNFFNTGTTNIDTSLLADLQTTTTYPPQLLTNGTFTNSPLGPVAQRDTDIPDLGHHYSPLDYYVPNSLGVSGAVTLTNGAAIGIVGQQTLNLGGGLNSQGTALNHNHVCPNYSVQESPGPINSSGTYFLGVASCLQARFTDFDDVGNALLVSLDVTNADVRDCNFGAGWVCCYGPASVVWNNVFEETPLLFLSAAPAAMSFHNNLFKGGYAVSFDDMTNASWTIEDNAFDGCTLYFWPGSSYVRGYNAYINAAGTFSTNLTDIILTNFNYATGPLGCYYQLSTDLLNKGSTNAAALGLYHYTVTTNGAPEGTNWVSIGYHYVSMSCCELVADTIWVEDSIPAGAFEVTPWTWVSENPTPFSGALAHPTESYERHWFSGATNTLTVDTGDTLFTYAYLDPNNLPDSITVAWGDEYECNAASWGNDVCGTYMGSLPPAGQWVRLKVPASVVGLEGVTLIQMVFESDGGRTTWDCSGKRKVTTLCYDTDGDGLPDYLEDANGNGVVDSGETDFQNPDTDGDGLPDPVDADPLNYDHSTPAFTITYPPEGAIF